MILREWGEKQNPANKAYFVASLLWLVLLSSGCSQPAATCYQQPRVDLSGALAYAADDELEFQYPLPELGLKDYPEPARFCKASRGSNRKYHAAEDYHLPAGTPVYAFADGVISFSGRMGGYGWLIIIDHPQANIYSLYGHLSPSRWKLKSGAVEKGDLIGYLGDSDENGGSAKNPMVTHLHFGIRAGQRTDYSGQGEWRWMAGWIKPCPSDVGWLKPSQVITGQEIPPGGFPEPEGSLFEKWGEELILSLFNVGGGLVALIYSLKKKKTFISIFATAMLALAGGVFSIKGTRGYYALFAMAVLGLGIVIYQYLQKRNEEQGEGEGREAQEEQGQQ